MQQMKTVVVGDGAVGKTCLLASFATAKFPKEYVPTIFNNQSVPVGVDGRDVLLSIFDTAGQEDYDKMRPISYPGTDVFIVCYSVDMPASKANVLQKWLPEIKQHCPTVPFVLCACKVDMRQDGQADTVSSEEGDQIAKDTKASRFVECSALTQVGVKQVFEEAIRVVFERRAAPTNKKKQMACVLL